MDLGEIKRRGELLERLEETKKTWLDVYKLLDEAATLLRELEQEDEADEVQTKADWARSKLR